MMLVTLPFSSFAGGPISEAEAQAEAYLNSQESNNNLETRQTYYPTYKITPKSSDGATEYYLNVYAGRDADGTNVCLWEEDGSTEQVWIRIPGSVSGTYKLRTACSSTRVLDAYRPLTSGANADIYSPNDDPAQNIIMQAVGDAYLIRLNSNQNLVLTAGSNANNSNVTWTTYVSGNNNQLWYFEPQGTIVDPNSLYADLGWKYMFRTSSGAEDISVNQIYRGYSSSSSHYAMDIKADDGKAVYSATGGTVLRSGGAQYYYLYNEEKPEGADSRGYYVVVNTGDTDPVSGRTMYARYIHLKNVPPVYSGDTVTTSTKIGEVGLSGEYVGGFYTHLHFDVNTKTSAQYYGDGYNTSNTIDPTLFFPNINFTSATSTSLTSPDTLNTGHWEIVPGSMIDMRYIDAVGVEAFENWADTLEIGEMNMSSFCEEFNLTQADIQQIDLTYNIGTTTEIQ